MDHLWDFLGFPMECIGFPPVTIWGLRRHNLVFPGVPFESPGSPFRLHGSPFWVLGVYFWFPRAFQKVPRTTPKAPLQDSSETTWGFLGSPRFSWACIGGSQGTVLGAQRDQLGCPSRSFGFLRELHMVLRGTTDSSPMHHMDGRQLPGLPI